MVVSERPAVSDLATARARLAAEWQAADPHTPAEIMDFYRHAEGLADDLAAWHETPERKKGTRFVVAAAKALPATRILDVGAGAGHDLRALREALPGAVLWAVEPNAALRRQLQGVDAAYTRIEHVPADQPFDMALCMDVLEHVPDPDALLVEIIARLRMGGVLVESTSAHDLGTPLHLRELRGYSPGRFLDRHGFVVREQVGNARVWQRMSEARGTEPSILLCYYRALSPGTDDAVDKLVNMGWRRQNHQGDALISRVRSKAVSDWLRHDDGDVFLMVDDDILFTPADAAKVVQLARETRSIACAAYPVRGGTHLACRQLPETANMLFGPGRPPFPIRWAGTGFMAAHREVCEAIAATMPLCHTDQPWAFWPLFAPLVLDSGQIHEYLSEDWAFCERARELGFEVWLDPSVILGHTGEYVYSVYNMTGANQEDAPPEVQDA